MAEQDVEGVADDERADEDGDERESEQDVAEDVECPAEVVLLLGHHDVAAHRFHVRWQRPVQSIHERVGVDTVPGDIDPVNLPVETGQTLDLVEGERHQDSTSHRVVLAKTRQPDQLEWLATCGAHDVVLLADHEVVPVGAVDIHRELVGRLGRAALSERQAADLRVGPIERQDWRAGGLYRITVRFERHEQHALEARLRDIDTVHAGNHLDEPFVDRQIHEVDFLEVHPRANLGVEGRIRVFDDRVERLGQAVCQDERRHDKAHAHEHGERCEKETQLAGSKVAEREAKHLAHDGYSSSALMRSKTSLGVGSSRRPTSSPSRRKMTTSA